MGEATWLGRNPNGDYVTVRRLTGEPAAAEFDAVTQRVATFDSPAPALVPSLGAQRVRDELWLVSELDDGVWLDRLLAVTDVLAAQAVVIGLDVVEAVRTLHEAGHAHGAISAGQFRVGVDGRVRLDGWLAGALAESTPLAQADSAPVAQADSAPVAQAESAPVAQVDSTARRQQDDLAAVATVLRDLAEPARRRGSGGDAAALLGALDAAARAAAPENPRPPTGPPTAAGPPTGTGPTADGPSTARADAVRASLVALCDPEREANARGELAALVRAASGFAAPAEPAEPPPEPGPGGPIGKVVSAQQRQDRLRGWLRIAWRRVWTTLVALAVVAGVVGVEFALLHDRLMQDLQLLTGGASAGQNAEGTGAPAPPALPPVPRPAPPNAGPVERVDLRGLNSCAPGTACAVRVLVQLAPAAAHPNPAPADRPHPPQAVRWTFQAIDRCSGAEHILAGGTLPVPPGGTQVQAVDTVRVPPGRALALVAVTSQPAIAASEALLVPTDQTSC